MMKIDCQIPTERSWNSRAYLFLLSTVFFLYANLVHAEYDFIADRLEKAVVEAGTNSAAKTKAQNELTEYYLTQNKLQEAIWVLRNQGKQAKANELEKQLVRSFSTADLVVEHTYSYTNDKPHKVRLGDTGLYAIFKSAGKYSENELLAYKLDKLLNLNIVPFTIMIDHPQLGKGSLQYFVRNTISPEDYRIRNNLNMGNLSATPYPKELKKLWLLDYLIENMDRNSNWLVRSGGKIVAIDHAHSLGRLFGSNVSLQPELYPKNKTLELLNSLDKKDFAEFGKKAEILFNKKSRLLNAITEEAKKCGGSF